MAFPHFVWMWHGTELQHLATCLEIVVTLTYVVWSTWNFKGVMRVCGLPQQCNNCNLRQQPSLLARGNGTKRRFAPLCVVRGRRCFGGDSIGSQLLRWLLFRSGNFQVFDVLENWSGGVAPFLHSALLLMPLWHRIRHFALSLVVGLWGCSEGTGLSCAWTRPTLLAVLIWLGLQRGC